MANISPKTPSEYTLDALANFSAREKVRDREKLSKEPVSRRIILTLVRSGKDLHLEAREDSWIERIKIFLFRDDYKLERIQQFINTLSIERPILDTYNQLLANKIAKRVYKPDFWHIFLPKVILPTRPKLTPTPPPKPPAGATYGMENPAVNACFLNATVQALGKIPHFRELIAQNEERCASLLRGIYEKMEKETVGVQDIQTLRQHLIDTGFREPDTTLYSQEDAGRLAMHMLDLLKAPLFTYAMDIDYNVGFPIVSLDKQQDVANVLPVAIREANTLEELVRNVPVVESYDKQATKSAPPVLTRTQEANMNALADGAPINTIQTVSFLKDKEPRILPIWLKRYKEDGTKIDTPIAPSQTLDFPIRGLKTQAARYKLVAAVVHSGKTTRSGHFYTFIPKVEGDTVSWIEYNDSVVRAPSSEEALREISRKGYIYYYEYVGRVKKQ